MSFGIGTYKEVEVRALDPFFAICIKHPGCFRVIIADNREIILGHILAAESSIGTSSLR